MTNLGSKSIKLLQSTSVGEQPLLDNASLTLLQIRSAKPQANDVQSIKTYFNSNAVLNQTVEEIYNNFIQLKHFIFLLMLIWFYLCY